MSSRDDAAHGRGEPPNGPIFVPEGPMWDAWLGPDGGAVKLSAKAMKVEARWLRRARQRPFGFAPGSAHPMPERIGDAHGAGTLSSGVATMLGLRTAVHTMSIRYGDAADPLAATAEIISDFHRDHQDRDLEEQLLHATGTWAARGPAPDVAAADGTTADARPGVTPAVTDVVVSGRQRPVTVLRLGEFSAFQVRAERVLVTVLARRMASPLPDIVRLSDLGPMLSVLEHPDKQAIVAAFAERRRQRIEQMRRQT